MCSIPMKLQTAPNAVFEYLRKLFVLEIEKVEDEEIIYRSNISIETDVLNFVKEYERATSTKFVSYYEKGNPQKIVYHKAWNCSHSSRRKVKNSKKDAGCKAAVDVLIKKVNPNTMKNDPYLKLSPPLRCVIRIKPKHTHPLPNPVDVIRELEVIEDKAESILPDAPNLAIVKKEPLDDTEDIPSTSVDTPIVQNSSGFVVPVKSEPTTFQNRMADKTVLDNSGGDIFQSTTSAVTGGGSSTPFTCIDGSEPPPKRPYLSQRETTSSIGIKDEFSIFGDFVTAKIRSFTDRRLQIEAQHSITNILFEIEMKDVNEDSLPVISEISSVQKPLATKITLPPCSTMSNNSNLKTHLTATVMLPSNFAISKISNLPAPLPATAATPSSSAASKISSFQTQLPVTVTPSSSSAVLISNLQAPLPSNSAASKVSILQTQLPATMLPLSSSAARKVSVLQAQLPATVKQLSSSSISSTSSLQTPLPVTVFSGKSRALTLQELQSKMPSTVSPPSSSSASNISSFQTPLPATVTPSSSSAVLTSNLQTPLPTIMTLPSRSALSFQKQLPVTVTLPSSSGISRVSNLQELQAQMSATVPLHSSSPIRMVSNLQELQAQMPATVPVDFPSTSPDAISTQATPNIPKQT